MSIKSSCLLDNRGTALLACMCLVANILPWCLQQTGTVIQFRCHMSRNAEHSNHMADTPHEKPKEAKIRFWKLQLKQDINIIIYKI